WSAGALRWMCGYGARCYSAYTVVWDANGSRWDDHGYNSPGCASVRAAWNIPGINISLIGHSQGGIGIAHFIHDAVNGFGGGWSCGADFYQAAAWVGNLHTFSSPFNGNQLANAMTNRYFCGYWTVASYFAPTPFFVATGFAASNSVWALTSSNMDKFPSWI